MLVTSATLAMILIFTSILESYTVERSRYPSSTQQHIVDGCAAIQIVSGTTFATTWVRVHLRVQALVHPVLNPPLRTLHRCLHHLYRARETVLVWRHGVLWYALASDIIRVVFRN